jgi:hypothetical protein
MVIFAKFSLFECSSFWGAGQFRGGKRMSRKQYATEQIIGKLRESEMALAQGQTAAQVCHTSGIANQN